jgi:thiamine kinase-like enzyme
MVKQLDFRFFARDVEFRADSKTSRIGYTKNGLVFKERPEPGKAKQEFLATQLARLLLPQSMAPIPTWGVVGNYFVSDHAGPNNFQPANAEHAKRGAKYLADLHSIQVSKERADAMYSNGFAHYFGEALRNRLIDEFCKARLAYSSVQSLEGAIDDLRQVVEEVQAWDLNGNPVLGHGDFQAANLKLINGRIVPLDWTDFGLCNRAYEVMHYVSSLNQNVRKGALEVYKQETGNEITEIERRGNVLDAIIRAGSKARHVCDLGYSAQDQTLQLKFSEHVRRAKENISLIEGRSNCNAQ